MELEFSWNHRKSEANRRKHGVTFMEARTVFGDPLGLLRVDDAHSLGEVRLVLLGRSDNGRMLVVSFTERSETTIRLISARLATSRERRTYEETTP